MANRFGIGSNSYGQFWFGGSSFPGFLYKKNLGVGGKRSTLFNAGGNTICNKPTTLWNSFVPGSGVGSSSVASRRAKMIRATACTNNQMCGRFYTQLGRPE